LFPWVGSVRVIIAPPKTLPGETITPENKE
jgi:hypothetical protein